MTIGVKLLTRQLSYRIRLSPAKAKVPSTNPFVRGYLRRIRQYHRSHAVEGANGSTMVVMFVDCCAGGQWYFPYYFYRKNPTRGGSFLFPPETMVIAAVNVNKRISDAGVPFL